MFNKLGEIATNVGTKVAGMNDAQKIGGGLLGGYIGGRIDAHFGLTKKAVATAAKVTGVSKATEGCKNYFANKAKAAKNDAIISEVAAEEAQKTRAASAEEASAESTVTVDAKAETVSVTQDNAATSETK